MAAVFGTSKADLRSTLASAATAAAAATAAGAAATAAAAATAPRPPDPPADPFVAVFGTPADALHAILIRSGDGAAAGAAGVAALRASAWALGAPLHVVRAALSMGGSGFWVFTGGLPPATLAAVRAEVGAVGGRFRHPIFNSTTVATMRRRGRGGDRRRQQVALSAANLAAFGHVPGLRAALDGFGGLCRLLDRLWGGAPYRPLFPVALYSRPGAREQLPHADACPMEMVGEPPAVLGALAAVEDGTRLVTWPGAHAVLLAAGGEGGGRGGGGSGGGGGGGGGSGQDAAVAAAAARHGGRSVVVLPTGAVLVFRGDAVHAGAANPGRRPHARVHTYVVREGFARVADLEYTTLLPDMDAEGE